MTARRNRIVGLVAGLAVIAAACGGGSDDEAEAPDDVTEAPTEAAAAESTDTTPTEESATEDPAVGQSAEAGTETSTAEDGGELPMVTIGYLQVLGASEAAQRIENAAVDAIELLGWEFNRCDAEGVPDQMQTCADTLIDQGVDAIITDGTDMEVIVDQLGRAEEAGIPFINTGGTQSGYEPYAASFNPNDSALGQVLAEWIVDNAEPGPVFVNSAAFTAWGGAREDALAATIEGTEFTIDNTVDVDYADVVGTAADAVTTQLTSNPDTSVIWLTFDLAALGAGPAVADLADDEGGPVVATFYANCSTQEQMATGGVDVSVEENLEWSSWVAVDQLAAFFASDRPFDTEQQPVYTDQDGNEIQFSQQFIVLPEDVDPEGCEPGVGPYPSPSDEAAAGFVEFFTQKWTDEYGL